MTSLSKKAKYTEACTFKSKVGSWVLWGMEGVLWELNLFPDQRELEKAKSLPSGKLHFHLKEIKAYNAGKIQNLKGKIQLRGTPFQKKVYRALTRTKVGEVLSYKDLAIKAGSPKAYQAVGQAMRRNPIPLYIPCHRVIKSDGQIGGFSGGYRHTQVKKHLQSSEKQFLTKKTKTPTLL